MPRRVLTVDQVRKWEAHVFDEIQMPSLLVMESAGRSVFDVIASQHSVGCRVLLLAGTGNNAGDGFVVARHLAIAGYEVDCWVLGEASSIKGDALVMYQAMQGNAVRPQLIADLNRWENIAKTAPEYDVIIDALFGIGLNRALSGVPELAVCWANQQSLATRYAVDVPSGLLSDESKTLGAVFQAHMTVTFFAPKIGQLFFPGRSHCGELICQRLSSQDESISVDGQNIEWVRKEDIAQWLPLRQPTAHKGDHGRGVLIGGSAGMVGAAIMAATAALRSGVGLLQGVVPESCAPAAWANVPEWMCHGAAEEEGAFSPQAAPEIQAWCEGKTAVAIGPGMGQRAGTLAIVKAVLADDLPVVLDADALNAIATQSMDLFKTSCARLVLTPHPAEMARMAGISIHEVLAAPINTAQKFAKKSNAVVLLKGATSVVAAPDGRVGINTTGGPQLAKGGSGDVLTGILLALLCQGLPGYEATLAASFLLGKASELTNINERGVLASDLVRAIPEAMSFCQREK